LTTSFLIFCIYFLYCYSRFKYVFSGGMLSRVVIKEISVFSFWNVFGNFAYVCRTQGINILINVFFGVAVNAAYAVSVSVINAVNSFVQSFVTAIRPQIFKTYGERDLERFYLLITTGSKYTFSFLFILCCPILIAATSVLQFWLVDVPDYSVLFVRAFLIVALIDSFSNCLISGIQSAGKIKTYQIVVGSVIFLNLPFAYLLFFLGASPVSLFYSLLLISLISLPLRLMFLTKITKFDSWYYARTVILPCACFSLLSTLVNYGLKSFFALNNIFGLLSFFIVSGFVSLFFSYTIVMSKNERIAVFKAISRKFK